MLSPWLWLFELSKMLSLLSCFTFSCSIIFYRSIIHKTWTQQHHCSRQFCIQCPGSGNLWIYPYRLRSLHTHHRVGKLPSMCLQKDIDTKLIQYARQITLLTWTGPQPRDRKCFAHQSVTAAHCQHHPSQWHCNQHVAMNNLQPNQCNWHFNTYSKTKHFSILHLDSATKCWHNKASVSTEQYFPVW